MSDDALLATMTELTTYLNLRDEHRAAIDAATGALVNLESEILRLRAELLGHLHDYALGDFAPPEVVPVAPPDKKGRPKGSLDKKPRRAKRSSDDGPKVSPALNSKPAVQALETIKASGPEGVPLDKLQVKPWVVGLLARAHYAKKLPNGNWVAA